MPGSTERVAVDSKLTAIRAQGATVLLDGRGAKVAGFERGNFLGPTVVSGVTAEMELYKQARELMLVRFGASVRIPRCHPICRRCSGPCSV